MAVDTSMLQSLEWRLVGPFRGGRVPAVVGHPTERETFYFGACAGGVWKTTDAGAYWRNISDGHFTSSAIGALAISESDPNVLYAGTGETNIRGNVVHGDGVYRSTDGGQSWSNVGLRDSHSISTIRIHPSNPDVVYVAAFGHVWGQNEERGVFRSRDGGTSWEKVLHVSPRAGAIDLAMDMSNPRILYAAIWDAQRGPHYLRSGGPDSGIWKSTDGGDSWTELTKKPGLPTGTLGKIGVAASPAQPGRVWALIEAEDGALFRSDDGGEHWERICDNGDLRRRAWYYTHIFADPSDAETVWVLNLKCWKSVDGGKTFTAIPTPHGDNQDLWIDPHDSTRLIEGNDGGANVSFNGGRTWSTIYNQPTAQFYHVTTDSRTPYRLYGSQQDNTAMSVPSASARGAITMTEWFEPGGGESGYIALKPSDEDIIVGGAIGSGAGHGRLIRYNHRTDETRIITVWPEVHGMGRGAEALRYRFQWTFPILWSRHEADTLYVASNHVHKSTDDGHTWEEMSPDLSRNDPSTLGPSGGPITRDNTGAEAYGTIFALVESPHEAGVFWAGSDDGRLHITRDGMQTWQEITIPAEQLPEWALISIIEASPHDPATAYVAATRYKHDDFQPYLFKTTDYGASWTRIDDGLPRDDFTRTIREDPSARGLLYAGTETGVSISFDDGASWQRFQNNLPLCPIHDLLVRGTDLIAATHGRAFWILDDLSPLHQIAQEGVAGQPAALFAPRPAQRFKTYGRFGDPTKGYLTYGRAGGIVVSNEQDQRETGELEMTFADAGKNPPDGVLVHYWLRDAPKGKVTLTFRDSKGTTVRRFESAADPALQAEQEPVSGEGYEGSDSGEDLPAESLKVSAQPGANRFIWNMRYANAKGLDAVEPGAPPSALAPDMLLGPLAVPGSYTVELAANGQTLRQEFEIQADPRVAGSQDDLQAQFDLLIKVRDKLSQTHAAITRLRKVRAQATDWSKRLDDKQVTAAVDALKSTLAPIEERLIQPKASDPRQFPSGLSDKIAVLGPMIGNADVRPAQQYYDVFDKLSGEIDATIAELDAALTKSVPELNDAVRKASADAIVV